MARARYSQSTNVSCSRLSAAYSRCVRAALADGADLAGALARMQREYAALSREHETFVDWL